MRLAWRKPGEYGPPLGLIVGAVLALAGAASAAWLLLELPTPVCRLRQWTGVACPTCGSTRLAEALLRGDVAAAARSNPLVFAALSGATLWFVVSAVVRTFHLPAARLHLERGERRVALVVGAAIVLASWAYVIARGG